MKERKAVIRNAIIDSHFLVIPPPALMYHISIVTQHATRFWPALNIFVRRAHCTKFQLRIAL